MLWTGGADHAQPVCAYGGAAIKDQIADLKRGAEIIVCTPGRMIDLLTANNGRVTNLQRVRTRLHALGGGGPRCLGPPILTLLPTAAIVGLRLPGDVLGAGRGRPDV